MDGRWDETWHRLRTWTSGQGPSERLAAQILLADGFTRLDPSHPLGGSDGLRDAIAWRNQEKWVMAAYFPRNQVSFRKAKQKFLADARGVQAHGARGMAFVTNQELSNGQRDELCACVSHAVELYHLERIVALLDQPTMHQVRQQFLGIPGGSTDGTWDGTYLVPPMPEGWPKVWSPPEESEHYSDFEDDPDDLYWKYPRECTCGDIFTSSGTGHEGFRDSWGDGREFIGGAIPQGMEPEDLANPIVWHWLNLLWDAGQDECGEGNSAFEAREDWFKDARAKREFVQAMEGAQVEFDLFHPEQSKTLRWRKPWE